jgi:hypothetical protein
MLVSKTVHTYHRVNANVKPIEFAHLDKTSSLC